MRDIKFRAWVEIKTNLKFKWAYKETTKKYAEHFDEYKGEEVFENFNEWYEAQELYLDKCLANYKWEKFKVEMKMVYEGFWVQWWWVYMKDNKLTNIKDIMQYTWLKDKNWKEIYEWDIIEFEDEDFDWNLEKVKAVVNWSTEWDMIGWGFWKFEKIWWDKNWVELIPYNMEIIWNIYENPELLNT